MKIDNLLRDLCPEGVKRVRLGDCCIFQRGSTITAKDAVPGDVPVIAGGQKPAYYHNVANRFGETITVAGSGAYAGFVAYWKQPIYVSDAFTIAPKDGCCSYKYLYYFLKNNQEWIHNTKKGSGVPHVHPSSIDNLLLPLPPLPVQKAIVSYLDKLTSLTAELELQKKRYDFYRNRLLSFAPDSTTQFDARLTNNGDYHKGNVSALVKWAKLGEIGTFYGGLTGKSKADFQNGNAKFITYKNIYDNVALKVDVEDTVKISDGERQNTVQYGDILFTGSSETPEECGFSSVLTQKTDEKLYLNSFCFGFRLNDLSILSPDFAKHLFRSSAIRKEIRKTANGVTRYNVSKAKMAEILIPPLFRSRSVL